jgi:DNA repair photolyase
MTNLIYDPKGRAREYAALACNLYRGCDHGCAYCYAPSCLHMNPYEFYNPRTRPGDFLKELERDAEKLQGKTTDRVLLCFTCDPYQRLDVEAQITRKAIQIFHKYGLGVQALTKGGRRALRDLDLFTDKDAFATTLTFIHEEQSEKMEPGAALPLDREDTIRKFHEAGIETWVSLEPVFDPLDALVWIEHTAVFVDLFKVGKLNYSPLAKKIDWAKFGRDAEALLRSLGKRYYIKNDLRAFMLGDAKHD